LLPSIRRVVDVDSRQHLPASFRDVLAKANIRRDEVIQGRRHGSQLHPYLPEACLEPLWMEIQARIARRPGHLREYQEPFLVLNAYDLKLRTKQPTLQMARTAFLQMLEMRFHQHALDRRQTWVDIAFEDYPLDTNPPTTFRRR